MERYTALICFSLLPLALCANNATVFKIGPGYERVLEVRINGTWYSICFTRRISGIITGLICQRMGFRYDGSRRRYSFNDRQHAYVKHITCTGDSIESCSFVTPGRCDYPFHVSLGITCVLHTDVRLIRGKAHGGLVEVVHGTDRALACFDESYTKMHRVAEVTCRQMGYKRGATSMKNISSPSDKTTFVDISCTGEEESIESCKVAFKSRGSSCIGRGVLYLECKLSSETQTPFNVRLTRNSKVVQGANRGTVEIKLHGKWGVVCDNGWDKHDADVVCRQLGFTRADAFVQNATFGQGTGRVCWSNVACTGEESSLLQCPHEDVFGNRATRCDSVEAAGVICANTKFPINQDICSIVQTTVSIEVGTTFLQSPGYPANFDYDYDTICSCEVRHSAPNNRVTAYIHHRSYDGNHQEALIFTDENKTVIIFGDDDINGPIEFNSNGFKLMFKSNSRPGKGRFNIQLKALYFMDFTCAKHVTAQVYDTTITVNNTTVFKPIVQYRANGIIDGLIGGVTGVFLTLAFFFGIVFLLKRWGYVNFGKSFADRALKRIRQLEIQGKSNENGEDGSVLKDNCPVYVNTAFLHNETAKPQVTSASNMADVDETASTTETANRDGDYAELELREVEPPIYLDLRDCKP